jgi:CRP/FNR family transcriptional regulator, cyclic AMP receptor protein
MLIVHTRWVPPFVAATARFGAKSEPGQFSTMSTAANQDRIPILDARLEFSRHLSAEERAELGSFSLPVVTVEPSAVDASAFLTDRGAFGATVLDGIVMSAQRIGGQTGIQLLGPGDLLVPASDLSPGWLSDLEVRVPTPVRLALFGNELLGAATRWPRIIQGLYACMGDQLQRLTAQLVICQLPRVDERVLAMMWLLAESWGQVTSAGVRLPLPLTHETLGALVGARRPTITLALRKLTRDGSIVHQDTGWLLTELPPPPEPTDVKILPPEPLARSVSRWAPPVTPADPSLAWAELRDTVRRLREEHMEHRERVREQLKRVRTARLRMNAARERIARDTLSRRAPPSS